MDKHNHMGKREFKGIWIPASIWLDAKMTMQEKFFFVEIDSLDGDSGCYATNEYFSNFFGISRTRVSLVISSLVKKGYIKRTLIYKDGTKQIIKRVLNISYRPPLTKVKDPSLTKVKDPSLRKVKDPHQQKLKENNTVNNTSIIEEEAGEKLNYDYGKFKQKKEKKKNGRKPFDVWVNKIEKLDISEGNLGNLQDRMLVFSVYKEWTHSESFKEQWEFMSNQANVDPEIVLKAWCLNASWYLVKNFKVNKLSNWIKFESKNNEKNKRNTNGKGVNSEQQQAAMYAAAKYFE